MLFRVCFGFSVPAFHGHRAVSRVLVILTTCVTREYTLTLSGRSVGLHSAMHTLLVQTSRVVDLLSEHERTVGLLMPITSHVGQESK